MFIVQDRKNIVSWCLPNKGGIPAIISSLGNLQANTPDYVRNYFGFWNASVRPGRIDDNEFRLPKKGARFTLAISIITGK